MVRLARQFWLDVNNSLTFSNKLYLKESYFAYLQLLGNEFPLQESLAMSIS